MGENTSVYIDASLGKHSPISQDGIRQISTPISGQGIDNLASYDIDHDIITSPSEKLSRTDQDLNKYVLRSTTENKFASDNDVPDSILKRHPELASRDEGTLNPVKVARVMFSPAKEVISYRNEYLADEYNSSHLNTKTKRRTDVPINEQNQNYEQVTNYLSQDTQASGGETFWYRTLRDPKVPYVLSMYLQLFLNAVIILVVFYFSYIFVQTIRQDIDHKLAIYTADALEEISLCSRKYYTNKCSTENGQRRVPAMERACTEWAKCMNRDPSQIGKSKITAETFADIVNGFIKPISWKSLIFIIVLVFGTLLITNVAFGSYRSHTAPTLGDGENLKLLQERIRHQDSVIAKYQQIERNDHETTSRSVQLARLQSPHDLRQRGIHTGPDTSTMSPLHGRSNGYMKHV